MKQSHSQERRPEDAPTTQRAVLLCFLLFAKSFESGRNLFCLNTLCVTLKYMYYPGAWP